MDIEDSLNIIELPGKPTPAARPRVTRFKNTFDPKYKEKKSAKALIAQQWKQDPLDCPLTLDITFHMPLPESWSGKKKAAHKDRPHVSKPDTDNLLKFCMDSMNGLVFQDDSCIYSLHALKIYSEQPKTIIKIKSNTHDTKR
jgi:Holliday junction resolvase RusA-like endonuclease